LNLEKTIGSLLRIPMEDHGFVEPSSWTDEYKRILKLFEENLKSKASVFLAKAFPNLLNHYSLLNSNFMGRLTTHIHR